MTTTTQVVNTGAEGEEVTLTTEAEVKGTIIVGVDGVETTQHRASNTA